MKIFWQLDKVKLDFTKKCSMWNCHRRLQLTYVKANVFIYFAKLEGSLQTYTSVAKFYSWKNFSLIHWLHCDSRMKICHTSYQMHFISKGFKTTPHYVVHSTGRQTNKQKTQKKSNWYVTLENETTATSTNRMTIYSSLVNKQNKSGNLNGGKNKSHHKFQGTLV